MGGLRAVGQHATDVDEVVGDYPETNPALHSVVTFVATTIQSVAPLEYADAAFAPGSPFLAVAEPALLLFPLAFGALGGAIGYGDALDTFFLRLRFSLVGVESGIGGGQARRAPPFLFVRFDRGNQQFRVAGPLGIHFKVNDNLILRFLDLDHLAEFGGLARLALANGFGTGLEHTEQFALDVSVPAEHPRLGLPHHLLHQGTVISNSFRKTSKAACRMTSEERFTPAAISLLIPFLQLVLALGALAARGARNVQPTQLDAPATVAQLGSSFPRDVLDLLHAPDQHPHSIPQQAAVGRVVDVGLHHGSVHAHLASFDYLFLARDGHHARMDLLDHRRAQLAGESSHRLVVGNFAAADARELAIDQIGAHFTRQYSETPVAHMFQQGQAQHDIGGCAGPAPRLAFLASLAQLLLNQGDQAVIFQHLVGLTHPRLPQIGHLFGDEAIAKAALESAGGDHAERSWPLDSSRSIRNNCWLSSLIASKVCFTWR